MNGIDAVPGEECTEGSWQVAIEQAPHARPGRRSGQRALGESQDRNGMLPADGGELVEELVRRMARLEIVD